MQSKCTTSLSGVDNERINQVYATNNEGTAAWTNMEQIISNTNVNIPSEYNIEKAKNWVDNGSQL